jgi:MoxR-like ATPase
VTRDGSTLEHRGPARPEAASRRPALVCAFPRAIAFPLPDSGSGLGRQWLAEHGLADTEVSSRHVRIDRAGGVLRVADAGSRNGTWVDGARLGAGDLTPLRDGSVLRLGRTLFVYRAALRGALEPAPPVGELVGPFGLRGVTAALEGVRASRPANLLIAGETGTGKELVARAAAAALGRAKPFCAVNVAGIARGVFESQMFGHVAGAFSDARTASAGIFVAHDGGAVFLDEIGELGLELQAKLLRVLENREVLAVGAQRPERVNLAVIAATNRDLDDRVEQGEFRRDLLMRLASARIELPPLRARSEDLFEIAAALAARAGSRLLPESVEVEALERLLLSPWPGNVRELDAVLSAARRVDPEPGLRLWALEEVLGKAEAGKGALTREAADAAIEAEAGNVTAAAARLGVSRGKLLRLIKRSG